MIQSIDRAAHILASLQGARHLGITELAGEPRPPAFHDPWTGEVAAGARARRQGARHEPVHARPRAAEALECVPRHPRCAGARDALDRRTRPAHRLRDPARRPALRRGHRHPSQPPPRRLGADARDRRDDPLARVRARQGDPRLRPECRRPDPRRPLRSLTGATIVDPADLAVQLAQIVERGIAHEEDEAVLGESSIAAPIADRSGRIVAAVSVVLPTSEYPPGDTVLNDLRERRGTCRESSAPQPGRRRSRRAMARSRSRRLGGRAARWRGAAAGGWAGAICAMARSSSRS